MVRTIFVILLTAVAIMAVIALFSSGGSDLPSGAVVAFDRDDGCPPGWSEYRDADGRFIVGTGRHSVHDRYGDEVAEFESGEVGGERTHRLSVDEMPSHEHDVWVRDSPNPMGVAKWNAGNGYNLNFLSDDGPSENGWGSTLYAAGVGGSQAHNNMPPWVALNYCRRN